MTDYNALYLTLPIDWHTAKELNLAAATLTAMEKRGMVIVDRSAKPMRYSINSGKNSKAAILKALEENVAADDYETGIVLCTTNHEVLCIKRTNGGLKSWDHQEVTDRYFANVDHIWLYKDGFPTALKF